MTVAVSLTAVGLRFSPASSTRICSAWLRTFPARSVAAIRKLWVPTWAAVGFQVNRPVSPLIDALAGAPLNEYVKSPKPSPGELVSYSRSAPGEALVGGVEVKL